ncbi:hypothetical protein [Pseudomonas chlororaphis]|uniref:hypothetical protein n=1 Tax=Pseudomonas chlororaphis TaxID=587753 RepID=UPI003BF84E5E
MLGKQAIGLQGVGHRQWQSTGQGHFPRLPATQAADAEGDQQQRGAGQLAARLALEALADQRRVEVGVDRLLQGATEGRTQLLGVLLPGLDPGGELRVAAQVAFQQAPVALAELMVDVGVQVAFAGGRLII